MIFNKQAQKRIDSCHVERGIDETGIANNKTAAAAHINVHTLSLAGVGMIMVSLIVPWFWVKLAVSCSSLVLAVICLLAMSRRCGNSSTNVRDHRCLAVAGLMPTDRREEA
jgi:hypothetical protein